MLNQTRFLGPTKCVMKRKETSTPSDEPTADEGRRGRETAIVAMSDEDGVAVLPATSGPVFC